MIIPALHGPGHYQAGYASSWQVRLSTAECAANVPGVYVSDDVDVTLYVTVAGGAS